MISRATRPAADPRVARVPTTIHPTTAALSFQLSGMRLARCSEEPPRVRRPILALRQLGIDLGTARPPRVFASTAIADWSPPQGGSYPHRRHPDQLGGWCFPAVRP